MSRPPAPWTYHVKQTISEALGVSAPSVGQGMKWRMQHCPKCRRARSLSQYLHNPWDQTSRRYKLCATCRGYA